MSRTYRIEQWTREGQILRAEYVDENGDPYTLRTALECVDDLRGAYPAVVLRIVDNRRGQAIDEEAERRPWWLKGWPHTANSLSEASQMLRELAQALIVDGDKPMPKLSISVGLNAEYTGADKDDVRRGHVELLARLTGQELQQRGNTYETDGNGAYISTYASPPVEFVDEPEPVDAEAVAMAALQPDMLPDAEPLAEAGETEDALGVPGLTADEADDFMTGGAR